MFNVMMMGFVGVSTAQCVVEGEEKPKVGDRFVDGTFKSMHSEYCKDISAYLINSSRMTN
jgi:hypothetical protein